MADSKDLRSALRAHLEFYEELGIAGISRDPAWRTRADSMKNTQTPKNSPPPEPRTTAPTPATTATAAAAATAASEPWTDAEDSGGIATAEIDAPPRDVVDILREVRTDIGDCTRCKLHKLGRTQIVFGVGNPRAQLMFVGEAPGQDEDIQGEPFVGRAGQLLTKIIEAIGLSRSDVYIANVIKCRPPNNRNPEPDEVATCEPFLFRQIDAIKPKVIVALGTFAAQCLLKTSDPISRMRGRAFNYRGAQLIPTFHPAFLLRSPDRKRDVWEDMKKVRALLQGEDE
jgi:uracil-DNA glycosylase family 4